jgi:ABC-type spermidine/putrescine transport system permease subunit I
MERQQNSNMAVHETYASLLLHFPVAYISKKKKKKKKKKQLH